MHVLIVIVREVVITFGIKKNRLCKSTLVQCQCYRSQHVYTLIMS